MVPNFRPEAGPYYQPSLMVYSEEARMTGGKFLCAIYEVFFRGRIKMRSELSLAIKRKSFAKICSVGLYRRK